LDTEKDIQTLIQPLNATATYEKLSKNIKEAASNGAKLITWGETLIPGYPEWLGMTGGAVFNDKKQKQAFGKYWKESVALDGPIVKDMCSLAKEHQVMLIGGIAEKEGGSVYCTVITIGMNGEVLGRHRKLKPTYEERLVWADGDGKGLVVHNTPFGKVGSLNCWENWLPLARAALHQQGEMIHVAVWPGSDTLTRDISRFMALEGRSWIISVGGILRYSDFEQLDPQEFSLKEQLFEHKKHRTRKLYLMEVQLLFRPQERLWQDHW